MGRATSDKTLLELRDRNIVEKFNQLYNLKRLRYDHVLYTMKWNFFFIDERRIRKILKKAKIKQPWRSVANSTQRAGKTVIEARNERLHLRFKELFDEKQMRMDDALELLRKEFYLIPETIEAILKQYHYYYERYGSQQSINF